MLVCTLGLQSSHLSSTRDPARLLRLALWALYHILWVRPVILKTFQVFCSFSPLEKPDCTPILAGGQGRGGMLMKLLKNCYGYCFNFEDLHLLQFSVFRSCQQCSWSNPLSNKYNYQEAHKDMHIYNLKVTWKWIDHTGDLVTCL